MNITKELQRTIEIIIKENEFITLDLERLKRLDETKDWKHFISLFLKESGLEYLFDLFNQIKRQENASKDYMMESWVESLKRRN